MLKIDFCNLLIIEVSQQKINSWPPSLLLLMSLRGRARGRLDLGSFSVGGGSEAERKLDR